MGGIIDGVCVYMMIDIIEGKRKRGGHVHILVGLWGALCGLYRESERDTERERAQANMADAMVRDL